MNRYLGEKWLWIDGSIAMRDELLERLSDDDLRFTPGGANMPLGELFREMGEVQVSYLQGLKALEQDFSYRNREEGLAGSVSRLTAWFHELDAEFQSVVESFSDDDLARTVLRAGGYQMPVEMSLDVYVQALLIFFGKVVVYIKAMNRELPESVKDWIW
jgi:hypothetical protein